MYQEQQGLTHTAPAVESESATTNHGENQTGAFPVVLSLGIVALLALLAFSLTSFIAGMLQGPLYASLRQQYFDDSSSGITWDYHDYGYDDWYYDDWGYDDWGYDEWTLEDFAPVGSYSRASSPSPVQRA